MNTTNQSYLLVTGEDGQPVRVVGPFDDGKEALAYQLGQDERGEVILLVRPPVMLDTAKARTLLWEIIRHPGYGEDYVYVKPDGESCVNWTGPHEDGKCHPSCLIGRLWFRLGFDEKAISRQNGSTGVLERLRSQGLLAVPAGDPVEVYLAAIQSAQDTKVPWGKAMRGGERSLVALLSEPDSYFDPNTTTQEDYLQPITRTATYQAALAAWDN